MIVLLPLEKIATFFKQHDHSMIETRRLKNAIFFETSLSFVLSRKIATFTITKSSEH